MASLTALEGSRVSMVCFVADYVEIDFDGPVLRAVAPPTIVLRGGAPVTFPEAGSRDALCRIIGDDLEAVEARPEQLLLSFRAGARLEIPIGQEPESVHYVPHPGGPIKVW
jgi:hypothetical protein